MPGYDFTDTIVAPATPLATGAIGIVRLSGLDSWDIARAVLRGLPAEVEPRRAYVCALPLPDSEVLDTAVALFWHAPLSYTGEYMAELMLHGNPLLLRHALRLCVEHGARPAEAGEFTFRAYLQGKLDLAQAEAVHELIRAGSTRAMALAASQLAGLPGRRIHDWQRRLQELLAGVEVIHDYAADDLDASLDPEQLLTLDKLRVALETLAGAMDAALEATSRGVAQRSGLTVALCGPPNVGKSTLFNALLGHARALTAPEPGTTRDYLTESLEDAGVHLTLVDTAGYRDSADAVEAAGVERAADWARSADHLLWITAADAASAAELPAELAGGEVVQVVTRCDLLPEWPVEPPLSAATEGRPTSGTDALVRPLQAGKPVPPIYVSGVTGRGIAELRATLRGFADELGEPALESFGARQAAGVEQSRRALGRASEALAANMPMDAAALDIYSALEHLYGIFEQHDRAKVIEQIFSGFCVGK